MKLIITRIVSLFLGLQDRTLKNPFPRSAKAQSSGIFLSRADDLFAELIHVDVQFFENTALN